MIPSIVARLVKAVNLAIAVLLVVAAAAVYWYCWRPLPQRSGSVPAPVASTVTVVSDQLGVPHIRAASEEDALFAQGYAAAQDRLWQMDGLRRFAGGNLAEIIGPSALESDRESRRMRLRRIAEEGYTRLPQQDRAAFAAYARGVNHFIATHLHNLPVEFTLLGYQPRPWSVVDSLLICLYMFRDLSTTWRDEVAKRSMLAAGDPVKVNALFPVRSGAEPQPGSNAWALAGSRTASGRPILANDMHLAYSLPGIWYMAHLEAPGLDASGVTLPGVPGIMVGHNRRIAWGITNLQYDLQDLYIEKIDERTGRYLFRGAAEQARAEREIIQVKGSAPTEFTVWVTRHGPLFYSDGNEHMALRWAAAEPGLMQYPVLQMNRAANWTEFTAALSRWPGPGLNFVYADVEGNIGYHVAGKLPKRRGYHGDVPVDGSSGEFDWDGFMAFEELPSAYNPPAGIIASANQNPFPADFAYPVNGNFAPPYRAQQIRDLLLRLKGWRASDMLAVQTDIYSGFNRFLAAQIVAAYQKRGMHSAALDAAIEMLRSWNGQMDRQQPAPFLITLAYQHVRRALAESAAPGKSLAYEFTLASSVIEGLLRERPSGWFRDYDEMLLRAFADAIEEGGRMQGRDVSRWNYGNFLRVEIRNPVMHNVPVVGKYFDIGPVPMSGASSTVKQTTRALAPSMRFTADLGDWERSTLNTLTGQSGQILSSHYRDQWQAYYNGTSFPMQFGKVDPKNTLELRPAAAR